MGGRTKRTLAIAVVALATIAWWVLTADPGLEQDLFFGRWRAMSFFVGVAGLWLLCALLLGGLSRRALFRFLGVSFAVGAALLVVEGAARAGLVDASALLGPRRTPLGTVAVPHLSETGVTHEDIATGWGLPARSFPYEYRTDRRGFRNAHDREAADVYLLGDSILVAAAVPFDETVCGRIEASTGLATANVALIAISLQEERDLLMAANVPLDGRLVLQFVFEGNDVLDSSAYRAAGRANAHRPPTSNSFLRNLAVALQRWTDGRRRRPSRLIAEFHGEEALFFWDRRSFARLDEEWPHITQALEQTRDHVLARGGTYGVVYVPAKIRVLGPHCRWPTPNEHLPHLNPLRDRLLRWLAQEGIPALDVTAPLEALAAAGRSPFFLGDTHPNADGHEAMARAIVESEAFRAWRDRHR
jgi:hypothetical protein